MAGWGATRTWRRWSSASRDARPGRTLLLDGGDTLQGSATALWTRGLDMVRVMNQLGVEVFTPHWEFTHGLERVKELFGDKDSRGLFQGDFVCHNARELNWDEPVFAPYTIKHVGGVAVGVIGQAFPYVPVSHPARFVPGLTFGIQDAQAQRLVDELRDVKKCRRRRASEPQRAVDRREDGRPRARHRRDPGRAYP